ncbi:MAG: Ig-like domain-containing protein [Chloroflexota bacterium]
MRSRLFLPPLFRAIVLFFVVASLGVLACDLSTFGLGLAAKPTVTILVPVPGAQLNEGEEVQVQSLATDPTGIVRVELAVDGAVVATDVPPIPKGQTTYTLIQRWKATPGTHTMSVRAFNASGAASDPALLSVVVAPALAHPTPIPTQVVQPPIGAPSPTLPQPIVTQPSAPATATATRAPTRPPASPTISAPPGVYATSIRLDPKEPKRNQVVKFWVTFWNNTGAPQTYRWRILIFPPDAKNAKGDTATVDTTMPVGTSEFASADNWTIRGPGDCEQYFARVFWLDESRNPNEFLKPDRSGGPATQFSICP